LDNASLSVSPRVIDAYAETAGRVRIAATQISHNQPGDPEKLAQAVIALVDAPNPPLRLPLGSDTLKVIRDKIESLTRETAEWEALALSTDFPAGT
ncbi:MAG: short-chain dehydrogenase/reductase, partial [Variovorax sp.]